MARLSRPVPLLARERHAALYLCPAGPLCLVPGTCLVLACQGPGNSRTLKTHASESPDLHLILSTQNIIGLTQVISNLLGNDLH